jgi:hypothetical protein
MLQTTNKLLFQCIMTVDEQHLSFSMLLPTENPEEPSHFHMVITHLPVADRLQMLGKGLCLPRGPQPFRPGKSASGISLWPIGAAIAFGMDGHSGRVAAFGTHTYRVFAISGNGHWTPLPDPQTLPLKPYFHRATPHAQVEIGTESSAGDFACRATPQPSRS